MTEERRSASSYTRPTANSIPLGHWDIGYFDDDDDDDDGLKKSPRKAQLKLTWYMQTKTGHRLSS